MADEILTTPVYDDAALEKEYAEKCQHDHPEEYLGSPCQRAHLSQRTYHRQEQGDGHKHPKRAAGENGGKKALAAASE